MAWIVLRTEGEYWFTITRDFRTVPCISRLDVCVLSLVGGGVCEQFSPGGGEESVEAIRMGHVWEEEGGDVGGLGVAALSSGALRLVVFVIGVGVSLLALSWVVPLVPL